jgi:outer membrane immunogenic protein
MHMKQAFLAGLGVTLFAAAASAADLPPRLAARAPAVVAPYFSWTGFYVGANVGWGWSSGSGTITLGASTGPTSGSGNGPFGGVQAGYNWQTGALVLGVEADIQASAGKGTATGQAGITTITATTKNPWFGTIRGRLGYAVDRWLWYVTGGGAYGEAKADGTLSTTGAFSSSVTAWTWTLGGGVEAALWDRWSAKLEYLYADTPNRVPVPFGTVNTTGRIDSHLVRTGLNYRF